MKMSKQYLSLVTYLIAKTFPRFVRRNERALYHYNALTRKSGFPDVMRKMAKRPELVDKLAGEVSDYCRVTFKRIYPLNLPK
jgi:hypothetical protein